MPRAATESRAGRLGRALRSAVFFAVYFAYLTIVIGLGQRLVLWPAMLLAPRRRPRLVRAWLRFHARMTLRMARALAGFRVTIRGAIPAECCIVVMNHQSVLDIPIGLELVPGPYPLIPTRDRYRRGIPGISPLARLAGFPFVTQKRTLARSELTALTAGADLVARGERSYLIFPEGHRSRDGRMGRFMRNGLRIVLARAQRPVYCVVVDGMSHTRTFADAMVRFAGTTVQIRVLGPFAPPADEASVDTFIDTLHERMTATLAEMRVPTPGQEPRAADLLGAR
ncbi:MAG TPA: lysophospholipid acyltransferase family protein [Gemmatimonadaceae bacterium]|nr:lysophospholipid acyltransferase family protein [Gemmatimonadaceae bacterium]